MGLAEILMPISVGEFVSQYRGQRFAIIRGQRERAAGLITWPDLNDALSRLELTVNRVALFKDGSRIPEPTYINSLRNGEVKWLDGISVNRYVADGATLVVNRIDTLIPGVRNLAESCENELNTVVWANLYASWRTDNGFKTHWDTHDTLVVQVVGQKEWTVWEPTRLHPLRDDLDHVVPLPSAEPIWRGVLNVGDVLYMPRGWWHVAFPRNEPCIHVTLGFMDRTGIDLMKWICDQMRESCHARQDVPYWLDNGGQEAWLRELRRACLDCLADDVIGPFMNHLQLTSTARPSVYLSDMPYDTRLTAKSVLRLTSSRRLCFEVDAANGQAGFSHAGVQWRCSIAVVPALRLLSTQAPCRMEDMVAALGEHASVSELRSFVGALVMAGVVGVENQQS